MAFFLCEIKLYRIGDSEPTVKFEIIEQPNGWAKTIKKAESVLTGTKQKRYDYWLEFQDYAFQKAEFAKCFNRRKPSTDHWLNFSVGSSACHIAVSQILKRNELDVELYIDEILGLLGAEKIVNNLNDGNARIEITDENKQILEVLFNAGFINKYEIASDHKHYRKIKFKENAVNFKPD